MDKFDAFLAIVTTFTKCLYFFLATCTSSFVVSTNTDDATYISKKAHRSPKITKPPEHGTSHIICPAVRETTLYATSDTRKHISFDIEIWEASKINGAIALENVYSNCKNTEIPPKHGTPYAIFWKESFHLYSHLPFL